MLIAILAFCGWLVYSSFAEDSEDGLDGEDVVATQVMMAEESIDEQNKAVDEAQTDIMTDITAETVVTDETVEVDTIGEIIDNMTLEEKVYQLFIVTPEQLVDNVVSSLTVAGETTENALLNKPVGGVIFFKNNLESGEQTRLMLENMQAYAKESCGIGLWMAVNEEGGSVTRVEAMLGGTNTSSMQYYGSLGDTGTVYGVGQSIAGNIAQYGFNLDFAPVADININSANELGDRIFSSDAQTTAQMVSAMVGGLQDGGVSATLKHFPGLGAGDGNTHEGQTYIDRTYEQLEQEEFVSFQAGIDAGCDFVMVGHQVMTCTGDGRPADLSYTVVTEWLREDLGFDGVVVTDAHNMGAITDVYGSGTAAKLAIEAGADIVLMPADLDSAYNSVYSAVIDGEITQERIDESLRRILTAKEKQGLC